MGLQNREVGKFINILNGKFAIRVNEDTPGAVKRVNKLGNTVFEKYYEEFTARLVNIRTQDSSYGKNWLFDFQDGGDVYHLQLSYSNSYATAFLKMLPNIDITKEMKVQPSQKMVDGKAKSSLFVSQNGVTIKHAYTKDNPNGLPPMEQVTIKGQLQWDDTKRLEFLAAMVERDILPRLPKITEGSPLSTPAEALAVDESSTPADEDDY